MSGLGSAPITPLAMEAAREVNRHAGREVVHLEDPGLWINPTCTSLDEFIFAPSDVDGAWHLYGDEACAAYWYGGDLDIAYQLWRDGVLIDSFFEPFDEAAS